MKTWVKKSDRAQNVADLCLENKEKQQHGFVLLVMWNTIQNNLNYCSTVSPKIFSILVIPSQEVHFESSTNKISPWLNFLLVKVPHLVHCSTVYSVVIFFLEKIIVELQMYCQRQLLQQIDQVWYSQLSFHLLVVLQFLQYQQCL